jgi:DNA polymerase III alpha subunit (gram-positive type)
MTTTYSLRKNTPSAKTSVELCNFIFLDIETTGLRPDRGAKITEVAILNRNSNLLQWKSDAELSPEIFQIELPKILNHLQHGVVVGHNLRFDLWFISYEAERVGLEGPDIRFIDTLSLSRKVLSKNTGYRLGTLLKHFEIHVAGKLHTAITDAEATRALFWKLVEAGDISTVGDAGIKQLKWTNS